MREELLSMREEFSTAQLAKDMLEQQKIETDGLITQIENSKGNSSLPSTCTSSTFDVRRLFT